MGPIVWRVLGTGAAVLAAAGARNALSAVWKLVTGKEPPSNPESPDTTVYEAIGWALASGAAIGAARMFATRTAARYYKKSAGHLPKGLEQVN